MMELTHLRSLVAFTETCNFARAGEKLHLSASAVFGHIRQLEDAVGAKIYQRPGKSLVLTAEGEVLLRHAKGILVQHDLAVVAVREASDVCRGFLRFGCSPHTSMRITPYLFQAFLKKYPRVEIENVIADHLRLLDALHEGSVDVVLSTPVGSDHRFEAFRMWRHEMVLVVASTSHLARLTSVTARELRNVPFILPCSSTTRERDLRNLRTKLGFEPIVVMNHNQAGAIVELLKLGIGMSFLPSWSVAQEVGNGQLSVLHLDGRRMYDEMGLYHRNPAELSKVASSFLHIAKNWKSWLPIAKALAAVREPTHSSSRMK